MLHLYAGSCMCVYDNKIQAETSARYHANITTGLNLSANPQTPPSSSVTLTSAVIQNTSAGSPEGQNKPSPNFIIQELQQDQFHTD